MTDDENDLARTRRARGINDPIHHRATHHLMHDLGEVRLHARAFSCSEDDGDETASGVVIGVRNRFVGHLRTCVLQRNQRGGSRTVGVVD